MIATARSDRKGRALLGSLVYGTAAAAKLVHEAASEGIRSVLAGPTSGGALILALFACLIGGLAYAALWAALEGRVVTPGLLLLGFTALVVRGPVEGDGPGIPIVGDVFVVLTLSLLMLLTGALEHVARHLVSAAAASR